MPSKMNRTTHKVIEGICIPQVWQFAVPDEWDNDDIVIRNGELFYKDEKQDVPMKFEEVDIFSLAEQKQSDWDVEIIFEDECCSSDEEEDEECDAHPPYRCDGGCGKKMGEGNDDECKRICGDCEEEEEDEVKCGICEKKLEDTINCDYNDDIGEFCCKEPNCLRKFWGDEEKKDEEEEDLCEKCEDINCCTKDELICCMCCELLKCDMFSQNCGKCLKPMCMDCDNDERKINGENVCEKCERKKEKKERKKEQLLMSKEDK